MTPIWVGKLIKMMDNHKIEVGWYGADMNDKENEASTSNEEQQYLRWRWTPRYCADSRRKPVSSVMDLHECGMLLDGFTLKDKSPSGGMYKAAVKLIRERLEDYKREEAQAALEEEDHANT